MAGCSTVVLIIIWIKVCHYTEAVFSSYLDTLFLRFISPSSHQVFCFQWVFQTKFCMHFFHNIHGCLSHQNFYFNNIFNLILMHFSTILIAQYRNRAVPHCICFFCSHYFVYNIETFSQIWVSFTYYIVIVSGLCILC
jgi:hypothetical protein